MSIHIQLNQELCIGCGACEIACADQNDIALRHVAIFEAATDTIPAKTYTSTSCLHCNEAPCISICPDKCLYKDEETGLVLYDNSNCIGCGLCVDSCPVHSPIIDQNQKMVKCDGCYQRVLHNLSPACVAICPFDALQLIKDN